MSKTKFTLKNYFKELKKAWLLLVIFAILGAAGGAFYAFKKPVMYTASAKVLVYNSSIDNGSTVSPYSQIGELLLSKEVINEINKDSDDISDYTVVEAPRGVFTITATSGNEDHAKKVANTVIESTSGAIRYAFDDADDYRAMVLQEADQASPTVTTKTRIISIAIAAAAMLIIAAVIVFIKFDYSSEK